jgi:hypothetical protein
MNSVLFPKHSGKASATKRFVFGLMTLGLLVGLTGPAKAQYSFTTLDVPGATATLAVGISDAGQIVGQYCAGGPIHGFLRSDGSYTMLDVPDANRNLCLWDQRGRPAPRYPGQKSTSLE